MTERERRKGSPRCSPWLLGSTRAERAQKSRTSRQESLFRANVWHRWPSHYYQIQSGERRSEATNSTWILCCLQNHRLDLGQASIQNVRVYLLQRPSFYTSSLITTCQILCCSRSLPTVSNSIGRIITRANIFYGQANNIRIPCSQPTEWMYFQVSMKTQSVRAEWMWMRAV